MKIIYIILCGFITLFSCKQKENTLVVNNISDSIKYPLGMVELITFKFPNKWKNLENIDDNNPNFKIDKISNKGYDSIFYFIEKGSNSFYEKLKISKSKEIFIPSNITKEIYVNQGNLKIDSAHSVGVISKTPIFKLQFYKNGNKFQSSLIGEGDNVAYNYLTLITSTPLNKIIDYKIIYYNNQRFEHHSRYFYIDKDLNIYIKDFAVDEISTHFLGQERYKISPKGKFIFISGEKVGGKGSKSQTNLTKNWKGNYHFEATNRGDAKTTFDVTINSLKDIVIKINEDGSKETYPNIRADVVNSDKIRIKYNSSENEMGIIYVERSGDQYFISGNPIYFINPGTSEGELIKEK